MKRKLLSKFLMATLVAQSIFPLWCAMPVRADGEEIPIDEAHFPDPGFRSVIAQNYDTDHNGTLNDQERGVYNVYCKNYPNVYSIEGIEYFPEVRGVWCENCSITGKLDFTKNPEITGIWCSGNPITEIDLSGNPKLEWIYCFQCDLTELDLSHNPKMGYLEISENPKLTSIDLSVCPDLEHLIIFGCPLESLDLSNNTKLSHLDAQNTGLKHLDLGNNPNMKRLDVWGNHGLEVDVSGLPGLEFFNCADMGLTHLDVSHNPQLMALFCDWNDIAELDLSNNPRLCDLRCGCNELTSLDISHNPLIYYFQIFGNPISSVNINNNSRLRYILDQVEKGNGTMVYDPGSQSNDYTVDFGGDHEYMDELMYFISVKPSTQLIADNPNEAADVPEIYLNTKDGLSDSEDFVTRGEAIQTMYELAGSPAVSGSSRFTDVAGTFYEKAVIWGEQNHICYGYPNLCSDTFNGDMAIARQDFALMVHHYAEGKKWLSAFDYGRTDDKADFFEVDYYAWGAVTYAIQWEILETKSNHIYPHGRITTAEVQKGLTEFLAHVEKHAAINVSTEGGKGTFDNSGYNPQIPSNPDTPAPTDEQKEQISAFVERMYDKCMGRTSDPDGKMYWVNQLVKGALTGADLSEQFVFSLEVNRKNLSDRDFITLLYRVMMDRNPEEEGMNYWLTNLFSGTMTRYQVANGFITSEEFEAICLTYGIKRGSLDVAKVVPIEKFVKRMYEKSLERAAEQEGTYYWTFQLRDHLVNGATFSELVFFSEEMESKDLSNDKYIELLYNAMMDRPSDEGGKKYWLDNMANGMSKKEVLNGFINSPEFTGICDTYGIERGSL